MSELEKNKKKASFFLQKFNEIGVFGKFNIRVNSVCPTFVEMDISLNVHIKTI